MDKQSARCLGLEGGQIRSLAETPNRPLKTPPTSWQSATIIDGSTVFFLRYVCLYLAISMAQSIIRDRLLFLPFILKGLQKIAPSFLKGWKYFEGNVKGWTPK